MSARRERYIRDAWSMEDFLKLVVRTPAITPNQLVFAVIRGIKAINFNHAIPRLAHSNPVK